MVYLNESTVGLAAVAAYLITRLHRKESPELGPGLEVLLCAGPLIVGAHLLAEAVMSGTSAGVGGLLGGLGSMWIAISRIVSVCRR